jgi:glutathione S-transferase
MWAARLFTLEASFGTDGAQGFMLPVAKYLALRYGYTPGCGPAAKAHAREILGLLHERLLQAKKQGHEYLLGDELSALDVYVAAVLNALAPLPSEQCPMHRALRASFEYMQAELQDALTPPLLAHRDRIVSQHFELPLLV